METGYHLDDDSPRVLRSDPAGNAGRIAPMTSALPFIHETALVEPGAFVGAGTRIWHHAHVRTGASLGSDCTLGKNVFVDETVKIGNRVKIQNNVSLYRGVELDDEVFVGPHAVFTNDRLPRAISPDWTILPTRVRQGASIGANATVVCGNEIGEWAMIGAGAVVTRPVDGHRLVVGVPAKPSGWVCWCGSVVSRSSVRPDLLYCGSCSYPVT